MSQANNGLRPPRSKKRYLMCLEWARSQNAACMNNLRQVVQRKSMPATKKRETVNMVSYILGTLLPAFPYSDYRKQSKL